MRKKLGSGLKYKAVLWGKMSSAVIAAMLVDFVDEGGIDLAWFSRASYHLIEFCLTQPLQTYEFWEPLTIVSPERRAQAWPAHSTMQIKAADKNTRLIGKAIITTIAPASLLPAARTGRRTDSSALA